MRCDRYFRADGKNVMNGYAERMWARYSEVRPNCPPPARPLDMPAPLDAIYTAVILAAGANS